MISKIFETASIEEAGYDPDVEVPHLSRKSSSVRVETACQLGLHEPIRSPRYAHLRLILNAGQEMTGHVSEEPEGDEGGYVGVLRWRPFCQRDP